jgi:hypothetical protein
MPLALSLSVLHVPPMLVSKFNDAHSHKTADALPLYVDCPTSVNTSKGSCPIEPFTLRGGGGTMLTAEQVLKPYPLIETMGAIT